MHLFGTTPAGLTECLIHQWGKAEHFLGSRDSLKSKRNIAVALWLWDPLLLHKRSLPEDSNLRWDWNGGSLKAASAQLAWKWHPVRQDSILLEFVYSLEWSLLCNAVFPTGRKHGFGNQVGLAKFTVTDGDHGNFRLCGSWRLDSWVGTKNSTKLKATAAA